MRGGGEGAWHGGRGGERRRSDGKRGRGGGSDIVAHLNKKVGVHKWG